MRKDKVLDVISECILRDRYTHIVELDSNSLICLYCASKWRLDDRYDDDPIIDISVYNHPLYPDTYCRLRCDDCNRQFNFVDGMCWDDSCPLCFETKDKE